MHFKNRRGIQVNNITENRGFSQRITANGSFFGDIDNFKPETYNYIDVAARNA